MLYFLIRLPAAFQYITIRILTKSPQRVAFSLITHYSSYDQCFLVIQPVFAYAREIRSKMPVSACAWPEEKSALQTDI